MKTPIVSLWMMVIPQICYGSSNHAPGVVLWNPTKNMNMVYQWWFSPDDVHENSMDIACKIN